MPQNPIKLFHFYPQYLWEDVDFDLMQDTSSLGTIEGGREKKGIIWGLQIVPLSGMQVTVKAGVAMNSSGRLLYLPSDTNVTLASPAGNPSRSYVVLRPVDTDADNIPEPINPSNMVPLHISRTATVAAINGTAAGSPVYPSIVSGDLILMGFKLTAAMVTVTAANYDLLKRESGLSKELKIVRVVATTYTMDGSEDIIEVDAATAGGAVTITPPALTAWHNRGVEVIKYDSGGNSVTFSGTVNGTTNPTLDAQWDSIRVYSNGAALVQRG